MTTLRARGRGPLNMSMHPFYGAACACCAWRSERASNAVTLPDCANGNPIAANDRNYSDPVACQETGHIADRLVRADGQDLERQDIACLREPVNLGVI